MKVVKSKAGSFIENWAHKNGIDKGDISIGIEVGSLIRLLEESSTERDLNSSLRLRVREINERLSSQSDDGSLLTSAEDAFKLVSEREQCEDDLHASSERVRQLDVATSIVRESIKALDKKKQGIADADVAELELWQEELIGNSPQSAQFRSLLELSNEWVTRFGAGPDCNDAVLASSDLVTGTCLGVAGVNEGKIGEYDLCILDEASKATPSEALVPLLRSKKWVIVGDSKQLPPYVDSTLREKAVQDKYKLSNDLLKETLLSKLVPLIPDDFKSSLIYQHRMISAIGDLVNEIFYGNLISRRTTEHPVVSRVMSKPVTWYNTSRLVAKRESKAGWSYINNQEAQEIKRVLTRAQFYANAVNETNRTSDKMSVIVLTGYAAQKSQIESVISRDRARWQSLSIVVETIDAFQGREADFAIFSVTRSNPEMRPGHLKDRARINVALSRGRYGLCIIGDASFCDGLVGDNVIGEVLAYMRNHPETCTIEDIK
jgi:hypothetical protein